MKTYSPEEAARLVTRPTVSTLKKPTFKVQRQILLDGLTSLGWAVVTRYQGKPLKIPHATLLEGRDKAQLWFKPQAVYLGGNTGLGGARSVTEDMREVSAEYLDRKGRELIQEWEQMRR